MSSEKIASRILELPPYPFAAIDKKIEERKAMGKNVISFGIGDPDIRTPDLIIDKLCEESKKSSNHRYPSYMGMEEFRKAASDFMKRRFGVTLDYKEEVIALIGSKEGIAHFPLAVINPGEMAIVPEPAYPVYATSVSFAGGEVLYTSLLEENGFVFDPSSISDRVAEQAKILFICYPHNPTAATASISELEKIVNWANENNIIIVSDLAYSEITYGDYKAPSVLQIPDARKCTIEFHSLSKTFNMTGWRIAFAAGSAELVQALGKVKTNVDSGVFNPIQKAGIAALENMEELIRETVSIYEKRAVILTEALRKIGYEVQKPDATFYIWMKVPKEYSSQHFTQFLLEEADIVVVPGTAYGPSGEGYVRFSITVSEDEVEEAVARLSKLKV